MKFSVLMSVYFKENPDYFDQALESVINQTVSPNEIVIVEDGPLTTALYAVIKEYQRKYPKIIKTLVLEKNGGLGLALSAGLESCRYDFVARMDADDISLPERFEKQMSYIEQHPEIDVIGSGIVEYDESMAQPLSVKKVPEGQDEIYAYLKHRNPFNHMSVIYRKSAVLNVDSYEDCPYFEDYYLWCKLAKSNASFHNVSENLLKVRSGDSMFNRRGGLRYARHIYNFEVKIYRLKIINVFEFINNLTKRVLVSVVPNKFRALVYKKALRSES